MMLITAPSWNNKKLGLRPILSAKRPKIQIPAIMPHTVTAVHKPDFVKLKPSCLDKKLGIQIIMP